jgi:glycosyltransferase 2 family protein
MNANQVQLAPKNLTRRLAYGLLFGFLVFLVLVLVGDLRQISSHLLTFRWSYLPIIIGLTLVNYLLRFIKWHFYLHQIGVRDLPYPVSARLFVAGFPLAVTPGKVGEALKGLWLKQKAGIPAARGVSVVLAERISDGLGVLALSTLGVIAYPQYWPVFALVLGALISVIVLSQIRPIALSLIHIGERLPFFSRFAHLLFEFYEGSFALFRPRATLYAVSLGIISWLAEGIGLYFILMGLGLPPSWELLSIAVFILSFSTVIGAISALPGGLGATEVSVTGMLVLLLGLGTGTATAATLLVRLTTLWFGVGLGLIVWSFSRDLLGQGGLMGRINLPNKT